MNPEVFVEGNCFHTVFKYMIKNESSQGKEQLHSTVIMKVKNSDTCLGNNAF